MNSTPLRQPAPQAGSRKSPAAYVALLLALTSVGLGGLSWYQYQEIIRLRGKSLDDEASRKAMSSELARLKHRKDEAKSATSETVAETSPDEAREDGPPAPGGERMRGRRDERFAAIRTLMGSPEFQKLMQTQSQGAIEARFAALFKKLNLPPEALEKFKSLLAEKQAALRDALEVAREQGLNGRENRDQMRSVIQQTQAELDESIKSAIGDVAFSQYRQYEQTQPQRSTADQLGQRLSYTQTPLTDTQYDQLVGTLSTYGKSGNAEGFRFALGTGGGGVPTGPTATITNEVIAQASGYLTTDQVTALRQIQAEQQAARKAAELMRNAARNPGTTTAPATGGTTTPGKP